MDAQQHFERIRAACAEAVTEEELRALVGRAVAAKEAAAAAPGSAPQAAAHPAGHLAEAAAPPQADLARPRAYIGFEPSGTAHVGWMVCTDMVRRLVDAGFDVTILLADWHAQINDKLGGDLAAIQRCGAYMQDAFEALGIRRDEVRYVFASELAADAAYWARVVQVAKATSLARMRRAMTILGRSEDEAEADTSKFLYPAMQVADIFHLRMDLAYGGMDQRHAHMLARDAAKALGLPPPAAIHTPLVPGLQANGGRMDPAEAKMSKSKAESG
ncbi:MAG TPA: tyrosine--tRNA ligase, partial [Candidatus Thermoplasmatota archaeon]|nr:tyrosine--tRNA ligase [Candidatus Thermoplasmatota archaeon]